MYGFKVKYSLSINPSLFKPSKVIVFSNRYDLYSKSFNSTFFVNTLELLPSVIFTSETKPSFT